MPRSIEQIKNDCPKVIDLRKEAVRIKRENNLSDPLIRNGLEIQIATGRKEELVKYISQLEQLAVKTGFQPEETKEEITTPQTEDATTSQTVKKQLKIDTDNNYTNAEQEKRFIANQLYAATERQNGFTGLKQYHKDFCESEKLFSSENFSKFAQLVAKARVLIEGYADSNSKSPDGKASPGGLIAIKVEIMKYLEELCERDTDSFEPVLERTLMDTFTDFDKAVGGAFRDISRLKYERNIEKRDAGERDVRKIRVSRFIDWAKDLICNLPDNAARWKEVAIAVMLLTGRRQSEVLSSGIFEYVDENHLMFEGQLKRHTEELVPPTKIPVIGGMASHIVKAIQWLENFKKRTIPHDRTYKGLQKAAKESHNRCSRYISETMTKLESFVDITNNKTWKDSKKQNVFKGHLTRQIYAQICSKLFVPHDQKKHSYIADILLESRDAAPTYDRDIEVIDFEELTK